MERLSRTKKYANLRNQIEEELEQKVEEKEVVEQHVDQLVDQEIIENENTVIDSIEGVTSEEVTSNDETSFETEGNKDELSVSEEIVEEQVLNVETTTDGNSFIDDFIKEVSEYSKANGITDEKEAQQQLINSIRGVETTNTNVFEQVEVASDLDDLDEFANTLSIEIEKILKQAENKFETVDSTIVPIFGNESTVDSTVVVDEYSAPVSDTATVEEIIEIPEQVIEDVDVKVDEVSEVLVEDNNRTEVDSESLERTTIIENLDVLKEELNTEDELDANKLLSEVDENSKLDNTIGYEIKEDDFDDFEPKPNRVLNILFIILIIVLIIVLLLVGYWILVAKGII